MKLCEFISTLQAEGSKNELLDAEVVAVGNGQEIKDGSIKASHYYLVRVSTGDDEKTIKIYKD